MIQTPTPRYRIETLRRRAAEAGDPETLRALLEESRVLLQQAFQTESEEEARRLFRELRDQAERTGLTARQGATGALADRREEMAARIRHERLRLADSHGPDDMELAVDGLYSALCELGQNGDDLALRREALSALETAASLGAEFQRKIRELLDSPDVARASDVQALLDRISRLPLSPPVAVPSVSPAVQLSPDVIQRLAQARRLFYAGDYFEASDILTEILRLDPGNQEARERLAQVEDNIKRGIVPDSRVPFEARSAYGRAQSLERAGRFEEARQSYKLALEEARKGGVLLQNWQPAVEALLRVDNSIIARELRDEGDALLQNDQWREAVEKYDIVLKLLPDDSHARERAHLLRKLLEQTEAIQAQLSLAADNLPEIRQAVIDLLQTIRDLRPKLADSKRLSDIEAEAMTNARALKDRLVERSRQMADRARSVSDIYECKSALSEAVRLLDQARLQAPGDGEVPDLAQGLRAELVRLERAEANLNEAGRLLNLNTDTARRQARDSLRGMGEFKQDTGYLQLVAALRRQYLDEAETALRKKQMRLAEQGLADAQKEDLFQVLGASEEVSKLERNMRAARRETRLRFLGWSGGILIVLLALGGLARPLWVLGISPAPTATPAGVSLPVETAAPTETLMPTPTVTPTPAPTLTPTLTLTPLPSTTPAPAPRYGAVQQDTSALLSPQGGAPWAFTLRAAGPVQVLDEVRDAEGRLWYKVLYVRGDSILIGWAQARDINVQPTLSP